MTLDRQISNANLFFDGSNLDIDRQDEMEQVFSFAAPVYIGFRQISLERWKTTPLFYLSFSSQEAAARAVHAGLPYSVTLNYRRPGASETDGLEVTTRSLGPGFEQGALIVQDGRNRMPEQGQNLKLVPWADILQQLN